MFDNSAKKLKAIVAYFFYALIGISVIAFMIIVISAPALIAWAVLGVLVFNFINYISFLFIDAILTMCVDTHELKEHFIPSDDTEKTTKFSDFDSFVENDFKKDDTPQTPLNKAILLQNVRHNAEYTIIRIDDKELAAKFSKHLYCAGSGIVVTGVLDDGSYSVEIEGEECVLSKKEAAHIFVVKKEDDE